MGAPWRAAALMLLTLAACDRPLSVDVFAAKPGPVFDPIAFWTGHVHSVGVLETIGGAPTGTVETDCQGVAEGESGLHLRQILILGDGSRRNREWHLRRAAPGRFEATANDMIGVAAGQAAGSVFHWTWVLALPPGDWLHRVVMDQWMYLQPDGSLVNRTTIRKLGVGLAGVTERFTREHDDPAEPSHL